VGRPSARATVLAFVALAVGACGSGDAGGIESTVADEHAEFPSDAQPEGTQPWPEGRFTGNCASDEGGGFLCFYEDEMGRQGYVCLDASTRPQVMSAAGAHDPRRRFDHDGRALPPDNRCPDVADS
jgi:hypothetical protein